MHPRQLLRAVPALRRGARDARAAVSRARRGPSPGDPRRVALLDPDRRRARPAGGGPRGVDGDADAALSRRGAQGDAGADPRAVRPGGGGRPSDHGAGCAAFRGGARRAVPGPPRPRDRRGRLLQDRDSPDRRQAPGADRGRRRSDRGAVRRRGGHHPARGPRCRGHRHHAERPRPGPAEAHRGGASRRAARGGRRRVRPRPPSHQLREPPGRPSRLQGGHAGGGRHPVRPRAAPLGPLAPEVRAGLMELARPLDPVALRWGR